MNIWKDYLLPVMPVVLVIVGLLAVWLRRHRPYDLLRGLSVCALCAGCFAVGFVRAGWDKAAVAFLFIFVPGALIAIGRWSVLRHYQSTLPPERPDRQGATMNNVQPQCRIVAALITAFLMIPAMSASAQPTQNGPTSDWSRGDSGDKQTLIATAFDEPLYLEQLTPAEAEVKRKELSHTEFDIWLRRVQSARTYDSIWAAVSRRYVEREKLDVTQDEMDAIVKSVEQRMKSEPEQPADTTPTPAEWKGISVAWARASLLDWKVCKSLYEKYGGRVGMGSLGSWTALDGQYALLREHLKAGDIKLHHAEIENAFWNYARREHFADTYPKGDRLKHLLSTPPYLWGDVSGATAVHSGTIVSHIDSYGSGTGSRSELSNSGQMVTGFDYGDPAKLDWKGSIKWQLLRREGKSDVYQIEWNFKPTMGTSTSKAEELFFDGVTPSKLVVNTQWIISIEPVQPLAKESNRERIGSALGKDIYRDQLQDNPPSYSEVVHLFMAPAMEQFEHQHWEEIDMTDEEIREGVIWLTKQTQLTGGEAWERWQAKTIELQAKVDQRLREGQRQLDDPATLDEQRPKLKTMLRVVALERTHPHATEVWLLLHGRKFEKYLHCNYGGGRIIHQQFGPEALDAQRKLLQELEKAGKFEITDPELRKLAYDYWERPNHPGGFHTDHRILMLPWTKAHQEMIRENGGSVSAEEKPVAGPNAELGELIQQQKARDESIRRISYQGTVRQYAGLDVQRTNTESIDQFISRVASLAPEYDQVPPYSLSGCRDFGTGVYQFTMGDINADIPKYMNWFVDGKEFVQLMGRTPGSCEAIITNKRNDIQDDREASMVRLDIAAFRPVKDQPMSDVLEKAIGESKTPDAAGRPAWRLEKLNNNVGWKATFNYMQPMENPPGAKQVVWYRMYWEVIDGELVIVRVDQLSVVGDENTTPIGVILLDDHRLVDGKPVPFRVRHFRLGKVVKGGEFTITDLKLNDSLMCQHAR